jgi:hypothetical protein
LIAKNRIPKIAEKSPEIAENESLPKSLKIARFEPKISPPCC